ncbi:class I SAM-dependent DNA methyltransferase [Alicyclobacillus suci]|uniref:class I SAM-dependent DNA methyltransferase n=1 Tax=Alicyclobacillus suci TaxID=2816080 RepID=UPI001A8E6FF9|nr:class I SAM-dependent methyltransferase [Alicyclobacillus suci]
MTAYEQFASVYDIFMADAPYQPWLHLIESRWQITNFHVADVGCGTGTLTVPLAAKARTCVGVDASEAMLAQAQERAYDARVHVELLCQDVRALWLPRPVHLAVSTCDVVNYIPGTDLRQVFQAVHDALVPGGTFAFDIIGPARLAALADGYWHQIEEDAVLLHETRVVGQTIEHDVHAFVQVDDGLYERVEEQHLQYFHSEADISAALRDCGFNVCEVLADFAHKPTDAADRLVFITRV